MSDLSDDIIRLAERGNKAAIATIVRTRGSTPREVGARMIVLPDGKTNGTVGGGCGEADVWAEAMEVLTTGRPRLVEVDLLHDTDEEGGRACGGIMYVFIEPLAPSVAPSSRDVEQLSSSDDGNE